MVDRTIIEDYIIQHSPMFERINNEYRKPETYSRVLNFLKVLLPSNSVKLISRPKEEGIFLFYFHRELRLLFSDLVKRIIRLAHGDDEGWLSFSDRFVSGIVEGIMPIVEKNPDVYQILEVGMRKLLKNELYHRIAETRLSGETLCQKTSKVIDGIFHKIRSSLAKKVILHTNILQETFLKIPLLIGDNDFDLLKNIRAQFLNYGIPFPIFYSIFAVHAQNRNERLFHLANDYLKEGNYLSKKDLLENFPLNLSGLSDDELSQLIQIIHDVSDKRISDCEDERKDIKQKLNSAREKLDSFLQKSLDGFRDALIKQQSFDKLKGINEKTVFNIGDFYHRFKELNADLVNIDKKIRETASLKTVEKKIFQNRLLSLKVRFPLILNIALCNERPNFDEHMSSEVRKAFELLQKEGREEEMELSRGLKKGGFFKEKFEVDLISERYWDARKEIIVPVAASVLLEEIVEILPKSDRVASLDEIVFVGELIDEKKSQSIPERLIDRYRKVISLLIYDIRGSTFMGTKLENAEVENEIRNLFNRAMLDVSRKFGGYPIKDTGDGGIIIFARNVLDQMDDLGVISEYEKSGSNAVQCAIGMIAGAEEFVKKNLKHYQNWFKESRIRELEFEGGSFAQLPPEYQQIFQIGIGVVSGWAPKEIYFDRNAFGDFDVTGMLVREANLFSKARSPDRSMIISDEATLFNIMLNSDAISFLSPEGSKMNITMLDIEQAIDHWLSMKKRRVGFVHEMRNIAFRKLDVRLSDGDHLRLDEVGISIDDFGLLVDDRGGRVKFAYEVVKL